MDGWKRDVEMEIENVSPWCGRAREQQGGLGGGLEVRGDEQLEERLER